MDFLVVFISMLIGGVLGYFAARRWYMETYGKMWSQKFKELSDKIKIITEQQRNKQDK
jgi:membrane protein DedA with SNARE-associated domain